VRRKNLENYSHTPEILYQLIINEKPQIIFIQVSCGNVLIPFVPKFPKILTLTRMNQQIDTKEKIGYRSQRKHGVILKFSANGFAFSP
jgi:hypothetical protein